VAPVIESMGRHLLASPYVATTLAAYALVTCGDDAQKRTWLPKIVDGAVATIGLTETDGNWRLDEIAAEGRVSGDSIALSGNKRFVLDAGLAELIVVSVRIDGAPRLVLIESSSLRDGARSREVVIDETRRSFALDLGGVVVPRTNLLPHAQLDAIEHAALLLLCAEISGGLAGALHVVVAYLNTRKQFGRLIGSYQSLKHPTVQILLAAEAAKSHLYHAATMLARGDMGAFEVSVRMAKAHGSEAFAEAGDRAVQFHGGFGFTYECDAQLFLRRALWCQYQFGDERHQRQLLAPLLFDAPKGAEGGSASRAL
jgi:alkylation response protein AidB-like acyl-CoA dehydrogenase